MQMHGNSEYKLRGKIILEINVNFLRDPPSKYFQAISCNERLAAKNRMMTNDL